MKGILVSLFAVGLLTGVSVAQSAPSQATPSASQETSATAGQSSAQAGTNASAAASQASKVSDKKAQVAGASRLQAGSTVQAALVKPVDAKKNKIGDEVVAKTTHDVKSEGHVVIPKGSKLIGHVTEVKAHSKEQATSELGIAFDHAILKNGTEMPLPLGIQAIGRSQASAAAMAYFWRRWSTGRRAVHSRRRGRRGRQYSGSSGEYCRLCWWSRLWLLIGEQPGRGWIARPESGDANSDFRERFHDQFAGRQRAPRQRDGDDPAG